MEKTSEFTLLENYYAAPGNQLIVLYGREYTGTSGIAREFAKDKPNSYYLARSCSKKEQLNMWVNELKEEGAQFAPGPDYSDIFYEIIAKRSQKKVIIIDQFQDIVKRSDDFFPQLLEFINNKWNNQQLLVILSTTAIAWVENSMVSKIGAAAQAITGFVKVKPPGFSKLAEKFDGWDFRQQIETYAVLGGARELWDLFDRDLTFKENICKNVLSPRSRLHSEARHFISDTFRETGIYDSILAGMARGYSKLNELYFHTGFDRSKISVYLKTLMEAEMVEKVFSMETAGKRNAMKGVYRPGMSYLHFYFRYIYPHLSRLDSMAAEDFYDKYIESDISRYTADYFRDACFEYMSEQNRQKLLPFDFNEIGTWYGKEGNIDILARDEEGHTILGLCNYDRPQMRFDDYEWLIFTARKARVRKDYIYLFSATGFDDTLKAMAGEREDVLLLEPGVLVES